MSVRSRFALLAPWSNRIVISLLCVPCRISGCNTESGVRVSGCERKGGQTLTIQGLYFGAAQALVFIGINQCTNVTHDATLPHRRLTCLVPLGSGFNQPLIVIQAGGGVSTTKATVSYAPCPPGTINAGASSCTGCEPGRFSATNSSNSCIDWSVSSFAHAFPLCTGSCSRASLSRWCGACSPLGSVALGSSSGCTTCTAGKFSGVRGSVCQDCVAGRFSRQSALSCDLCDAGKFSAYNASGSCTLCPRGEAQNLPGRDQWYALALLEALRFIASL